MINSEIIVVGIVILKSKRVLKNNWKIKTKKLF
jgi:hypothetical protein